MLFLPYRLRFIDQLVVEISNGSLVEVDPHRAHVEGRVLPAAVQGSVGRAAAAATAATASSVGTKRKDG